MKKWFSYTVLMFLLGAVAVSLYVTLTSCSQGSVASAFDTSTAALNTCSWDGASTVTAAGAGSIRVLPRPSSPFPADPELLIGNQFCTNPITHAVAHVSQIATINVAGSAGADELRFYEAQLHGKEVFWSAGGQPTDTLYLESGSSNDTFTFDDSATVHYADSSTSTVDNIVHVSGIAYITIKAVDGDDLIDGSGAGLPLHISGGNGNDTIIGSAFDDVLSGDAGDDTIFGGAGNDTITGGPGDDTLYGGEGSDSLDGNSGNDIFPDADFIHQSAVALGTAAACGAASECSVRNGDGHFFCRATAGCGAKALCAKLNADPSLSIICNTSADGPCACVTP